jgi:hypothetical protein
MSPKKATLDFHPLSCFGSEKPVIGHALQTFQSDASLSAKAEDRLDQHRVKVEWEQWKSIARSFGCFHPGLEILLLLLIIHAMAGHPAH